MTTVTRARRIALPAEQVWEVLADFPAISRWAPNVDHSGPASTPATGAGAVRRVQVGRMALLERVVVWQPATSLAYAIEGLPPAAGTVVTRWQLTADGDATQVTVTSAIDPMAGPPGRIVAKVLSRQLAKAADAMLAGLAGRLTRVEEPA